jgi:phosphohistidine phosphatase
LKTLYLMRHAKSDWANLNLSDHERPLNARGERDAPEMGRRLAEKKPRPEIIYASSAERVRATALHVAAAIGHPADDIVWRKDIYEGGVETVIQILGSTDDSIETAMLIGHNPTMSWCIANWSQGFGKHLPTAALACLRLDTQGWASISECSGELVDYDYPKLGAD